MTPWDWLAVLLGIFVVLVVLVDIFLAVLHLDIEGVLTPYMLRSVWSVTMFSSRRWPGMRRELVALAGPVMMVGIFVVWIVLFILGFALIVWPFLDTSYRIEPSMKRPLTFVDALYFSGVTATVLGYGDITPLSRVQKIIAFIESGLGFAMLTAGVAYLLNVVSGVTDRNALAIRVYGETGGTGDGVQFVSRYFHVGDLSDLRERIRELIGRLAHVHEKMHQFPILDIYYRSRVVLRDPEPMLQTLAEAALAGHILAQNAQAQPFRMAIDDLDRMTVRNMQLIAQQYFRKAAREQLEVPQPTDEDRRLIEQIGARLKQQLGEEVVLDVATEREPLLRLACQTRIFLNEMDRLTGWRMDLQRVNQSSR